MSNNGCEKRLYADDDDDNEDNADNDHDNDDVLAF